jgi:hypothetical protein
VHHLNFVIISAIINYTNFEIKGKLWNNLEPCGKPKFGRLGVEKQRKKNLPTKYSIDFFLSPFDIYIQKRRKQGKAAESLIILV